MPGDARAALTYAVTKPLDVTSLLFGDDDLARVFAFGCRYGGYWVSIVHPFTPSWQSATDRPVNVGEIRTTAQGDAAEAYATVVAWLEKACQAAGLRLAYVEDVSDQSPADTWPFLVTMKVLIDRRPPRRPRRVPGGDDHG
jgi:hypothetical protein